MSDEGLNIQPIFPLWAIGGGFVLLLSFFLWKEFTRKAKFLIWRIVALTVMMISILALFLQPSFVKEEKSNGIVLLTAHYNSLIADSIRIKNPSFIFLRTADAKPYPQADELESFYELADQKGIRFVLGDGLPTYVLEELGNSFQFFPSELPIGITKWQTSAIFKANQQSTLSGLFRSRGKSKIILRNPGGVEDSVEFNNRGNHSFNLTLTPRQSGMFVYEVVIQDSLGIQRQKFPVVVEAEKKLNILFFQKYPTSEVRYLKNQLIEKGHELAIRSQVSKNNFRYEYANRKPLRIDRLTTETLKSFDLFLIDNESLDLLNDLERKVLEESIKSGLGVVVLFNSIDLKKKISFFSVPIKNYLRDTAHIKLATGVYPFSALPIVVDANVEAVSQSMDRVLSGYINKGEGKIAFQFLQETYRLLLEGKTNDYATLWTPLLEHSARMENSKFNILPLIFPVYEDEPFALNVIAAQQEPRLSADGVLLPLREDVLIDDYWHGTAWAGESGWHQFEIEKDSVVKSYYVSNAEEWRSLRIAQQQTANEIASSQSSNLPKEIIGLGERKPISFLLFFLLFLLSAGFLWLAPKL